MSFWDRNPQLIAKINRFHDEKGLFASAANSSVAQRMMDSIRNGKDGDGFTYDTAGKVPSTGYSVGVHPEKSLTIPVERSL